MAKLKPREKRTLIIGGVILVLLFVLWFFFLWDNSLLNRWEDLKSKVADRRDTVEKMERLERGYFRLQAQIEEITSRMLDPAKSLAVKGFLEELLQEKAPDADLKRMKTSTNPVHDLYRKTVVSVKVGRITLPELVDYLYNVESSGQALQVNEIQIKNDLRALDRLDVEFTVISASALK